MLKRVAEVVYLIPEAQQKKCIHGLLGGHGHFCMAIDIKTSQAFMFCCL